MTTAAAEQTAVERLAAMAKMPRAKPGEPWPPRDMQLPTMDELNRLAREVDR